MDLEIQKWWYFANINRPIAGATHDKQLPVGKHPFQLYSLATPNGVKVTVMLEELLQMGVDDAEYDAWLIKICDGDQFSSGFVKVNPNSKIPVLVDHSLSPPIRVFESGNILLYLAEKFGSLFTAKYSSAIRVPLMAFLANGKHSISWRRLWPFLRLRTSKMNIQLIASLWKQNANLMFLIVNLRAMIMSVGLITILQTLPSGRGMGNWSLADYTKLQNFWM